MIIPELPNYLTSLGGANYKGLIISLFAITAALSRPFSGKLADLVGRRPVMFFGAAASAICCGLYPLVGGLMGFFALRLFHGLSTGFKPTGDTAYLADIVTDKNRGEALGLFGMSGTVGMAAGPAVGSILALKFGLDGMFIISSLTAVASILVIAGMPESIDTKSFKPAMLRVGWHDVYEPKVLAPALVMMLTVFSFGMALTIIPDFSEHLGIENKGLFFSVMLVASVVTRLFAGKASDRLGRESMLKRGAIVLAVAMVTVGLSENVEVFMLGALIFGVATGINSPTVFAWTVDLANTEQRGRAMATLFIALEFGILSGALASAEIYGNEPDRFGWAFGLGALLAIATLVLLLSLGRKR